MPGASRVPGRVTTAKVLKGAACGHSVTSSRATATSAAVKTACALVGDTAGPVRAPLLALDDDATFELGGLLDRAGATMATVQISQ